MISTSYAGFNTLLLLLCNMSVTEILVCIYLCFSLYCMMKI